MTKLQVTLNHNEADSLAQWAALELRDPRDQIRFILRQALEQAGYLSQADVISPSNKKRVQHENRE